MNFVYIPSKLDTGLSPMTMVKSSENKVMIDMSILTRLIQRLQQEKTMDFDYWEENLKSITNKMLLCHSVDIYRMMQNKKCS